MQKQGWLYNPRWDLTFLVFSAIIALAPYTAFLLFGGNLTDPAETVGTTAYNARVFTNLLVAIFIGGPHMYATFTRTMMDPTVFAKKKWLYISTAILIPLFVFGMAIYSYDSYVWLLTIFFGLASIHALHQVIWISGAYDMASKRTIKIWSQLIDFGVVFLSLYPIPVWKMVTGNFRVGPVDLKINEFINGWHWLGYLVSISFAVFLALYIVKSIYEWRRGELHYGKTILITVTVCIMFFMMFLPNTDTAAQGVNAWHSFQYLALTWFAHKLTEQRQGKERGFMHFWRNLYNRAKAASTNKWNIPAQIWKEFTSGMRKIDGDTGWSSFYLLTMALLPLSSLIVIVMGGLFPELHGDAPGADEVYTYMGLLSILLIHYVHDAFLFVDSEDIVAENIKQDNRNIDNHPSIQLATA